MSTILSYVRKEPLLPVVTITKNDASTYTFNYFTSTFDFRVRRLQCSPPFDSTGGKFSIKFTSGDGTNSATNTILTNINEGNEINIWIGKDDATKTKIFNGIIERTEINEPSKNFMDVKISGPDWGSDLLKSKIINRAWIQQKDDSGNLDDTDNNVLISQIVSDIITDANVHATGENAPDDHGVVYSAANVVVPSLRLPQFEANFEKIDDKLKELDNIVNTTHYIDANKNFIMRDPTSVAADSGVFLVDDHTLTGIGTNTKVGLIAPGSTYVRTLENHYRRIFGIGSNQRTLDKKQQTDATSTDLDANWLAVKFQPTNNKDCMQMAVGVSKKGSPTNSLVIQLKEDVGSEPVGTTIRQWSIPPADVASTIVWKYLDVNDEVHTDRSYWIVIPKVGTATNTYRWHRDSGTSNTNASSSTGLAASWTVNTSSYGYLFEHYVATPVITIRSDFASATAKHFHEEVIKRPDINDLQTMNIVLRNEFDNLNKKKEIFKGLIYAPDTLLQTGQTVTIKKSASGYTVDEEQFVLGEIEYIFESSDDQTTGSFYYDVEATRYTTY